MKKLATFISILCILNILMIGGLLGYLFGTGRLDKSKAQVIGDMLKVEGTPVHFREKVYDLMNTTASTQPATSTAPADELALHGDLPARAEDRVDFVRRQMEQERLQLKNATQDLQHRQEMLANVQADLAEKRKALEEDKKAFEKRMTASTSQSDNAGFQKMLGYFDDLKPKQIKELLAVMPVDDAARFIGAMDSSQVSKVMNEFKTPDEKTFIASVMEKMRKGSSDTGTGAASGGGAALSASAAPAPPTSP